MHKPAMFAAFVLAILSSNSRADITLIGVASIPGSAHDKSGLTELVGPAGATPTIPHDLLGSFGSGIDYTGRDNLYIACDDRGPANGEVPWRSRIQSFRILIHPGDPDPVKVELVATTLLSDVSGAPLNGIASAFDPKEPIRGLRFDPESIRITAGGTFLISDEYGPWIDEFSPKGTRLRRLPIPAKFTIEHPSANPKEEISLNKHGREPNRGFEGLALTPDRTIAVTVLQSPLLQDGALNDKGKRTGINLRMLHISLAAAPAIPRETVYQLDSPKHGVNELLAIDDHRFLALERDGAEAKSRALILLDAASATDVSAIESLSATTLPDTITPVAKKKWLDFMDDRFSLAKGTDGPLHAPIPEKIEGITFGPALADGRRTLIVTTDNDLRQESPSWFWVFAFEDKDFADSIANRGSPKQSSPPPLP